jgi:hypothetical protein
MSQADYESTTTHAHPGPVAPDALSFATGFPQSGFPATLAGMPAHELRALARQIRRAAADEIERLITLLDRIEPDPDLEPDHDADDPAEDDGTAEPSLGAIERHANAYGSDRNTSGSQVAWGASDRSDCEEDPGEDGIADQDGLAEQMNGEPSLGSFDRMLDQTKSWRQRDIPGVWWPPVDGELDTADHEPSLGSLACIPTFDPRFGWYGSQADWAYSGTDDREDEHDGREPEWEI